MSDIKKRGAHYTPRKLADEVVYNALRPFMGSKQRLKIIDPACGDGVFLLAAIDALTMLFNMSPLDAVGCVYGADINGNAVCDAREAVRTHVPGIDTSVLESHIVECDALFDLSDRLPGEFDVVVGNPPFLGGTKISTYWGADYLRRLKSTYPGPGGTADLCSYFFRLASKLIGDSGIIGYIATNTIAQGNSRRNGLQMLVNDGWVIYDATRSRPWPGSAAVTVAVVHLAKGSPVQSVRDSLMLDGRAVSAINSRLNPKPERKDPQKLSSNASMSFLGSKIYGQGFLLSPEERDALIAKDKRNAERIFPYIGGEEVNTSPTQDFHRYVINFGQMSLEEASQWPDLIQIVREKVKPERDKLRDNPDGRKLKQYWWQHGRTRPELYQSIQDLPRCLVISLHSKHLIFAWQPQNRVFSHAVCIFSLEQDSLFSVLQSRIHEDWAWLLSSTMRDAGIRYSATDCFETFPFPDQQHLTPNSPLEKIGQQLYEARAQYMVDTDQGLTKTYNALKDPSCSDPRIVQLRQLHEAMDRAVLAAYGWEDVFVPPYCPATPEEEAALEAFSDEVIDRLSVLNSIKK